MSIQALVWATDARRSGPMPIPTRMVLVVLADYASPDGRGAYPTVATIAERLGCTERNVQHHIATLEDMGLVRDGDQRLVWHYPPYHRPKVRNLIGVADMASGAPEYAPPLEEPVDNPDPGEAQRANPVQHSAPNPLVKPNTPTHLSSEGDTYTRASLAHATPKEPGAPIRAMGLTDRECPTCGAVVNRSHRCRKSAMDPDPQEPPPPTYLAAVERIPGQMALPVPVPDACGRAPCQWCGQTRVLNTDGICLRCYVFDPVNQATEDQP